MKTLSILVALAATVALSRPAAAQCPAGMALGDPGAEPVKITLRYYWKLAEVKPTALKTALEKLPTVAKVEFTGPGNLATVMFKGKCEQIGALESAAAAAGVPAFAVSHAHVLVVLKTQPGADVKKAVEALGTGFGVLFAKPSGAGLELHANLIDLSVDELRAKIAPFKCDLVINQSYEYVRFKVVVGKQADFAAAAGEIRGVVVVRPETEEISGMWINKAMVKADQIEKLPGFKVERQQ